jgi:hypothetical protein
MKLSFRPSYNSASTTVPTAQNLLASSYEAKLKPLTANQRQGWEFRIQAHHSFGSLVPDTNSFMQPLTVAFMIKQLNKMLFPLLSDQERLYNYPEGADLITPFLHLQNMLELCHESGITIPAHIFKSQGYEPPPLIKMPKSQVYKELCTKWNALFPHFPLLNLIDPSLGTHQPTLFNPKANTVPPPVRSVLQQFEKRSEEVSLDEAYGVSLHFYGTNEESIEQENKLLVKPIESNTVNKKANQFLDHLFDLIKPKTFSNP